ncbi:hypothetical protein KRR55_00510 [Paeniglutamicibacter sp. ABSL32-1]|nr:hypothetical protein [Paeniglutamicibacter quisquiliarum]
MMPMDAAQTLETTRQVPAHEHAWLVDSAHDTSDGRVLYVRCGAGCGARRIDLQGPSTLPPSAVSREFGR